MNTEAKPPVVLTNQDVMHVHRVLTSLAGQRCPPATAYAVAMNLRATAPVVQAVQQAAKPPPELDGYVEAYHATLARFAAPGTGVRPDGSVATADPDGLEAAIGALEKERPNQAEALQVHNESVKRLLDADAGGPNKVPLGFVQFRLSELPPLSPNDVIVLMPLLIVD